MTSRAEAWATPSAAIADEELTDPRQAWEIHSKEAGGDAGLFYFSKFLVEVSVVTGSLTRSSFVSAKDAKFAGGFANFGESVV